MVASRRLFVCFFVFIAAKGAADMKELEQKIVSEGKILPGNILKVGSFLNQQVDTGLTMRMGQEIARLFADCGVTKVLTVETSGLPLAFAAACTMNVPLVFAKKSVSANMSGNSYSAPVASYTHGKTYNVVVSADYIQSTDRILLVDDFLAIGNALRGLKSLCEQGSAQVVGAAIAIEKWYQGGGDALRSEGLRIESLAKIRALDENNGVAFCE